MASAFDEESCVARVSRLGGNRESAFPFVEAEGAELGSGSSRSVRRERGAEVFEAKDYDTGTRIPGTSICKCRWVWSGRAYDFGPAGAPSTAVAVATETRVSSVHELRATRGGRGANDAVPDSGAEYARETRTALTGNGDVQFAVTGKLPKASDGRQLGR